MTRHELRNGTRENSTVQRQHNGRHAWQRDKTNHHQSVQAERCRGASKSGVHDYRQVTTAKLFTLHFFNVRVLIAPQRNAQVSELLR